MLGEVQGSALTCDFLLHIGDGFQVFHVSDANYPPDHFGTGVAQAILEQLAHVCPLGQRLELPGVVHFLLVRVSRAPVLIPQRHKLLREKLPCVAYRSQQPQLVPLQRNATQRKRICLSQ